MTTLLECLDIGKHCHGFASPYTGITSVSLYSCKWDMLVLRMVYIYIFMHVLQYLLSLLRLSYVLNYPCFEHYMVCQTKSTSQNKLLGNYPYASCLVLHLVSGTPKCKSIPNGWHASLENPCMKSSLSKPVVCSLAMHLL